MTVRLPLATSTWDDKEHEALQRVIKSGYFTMGEEVRAFEQDFARFVGAKHALMVNSGSSANLIAVAALFFIKDNPLRAGDEVIVPAVSWSTTYAPLQQYGLKLKFVDINPQTLNLDIEKLEAAISPKTRLIFAVNLLGNPTDYQKLLSITAPLDIRVLEDNCESLGATLGQKQAGTFGIAGTYSSFFSHHISTMEGGVVVTDNDEIYHVLLSLRTHGWTRNLPKENRVCNIGDDPFEESFRFVLPGYNLRPLEMSGALGREQIKKIPGIVEGRRKNAEIFRELFTDHPIVDIQIETGESSWFGFAMILKGTALDRRQCLDLLMASGIESRPIVAGNFTRNPVIEYFDYSIHDNLNTADRIHDRGFFVGNHHFCIEEHLVELNRCIQKFAA